jgi:hypothetical protein
MLPIRADRFGHWMIEFTGRTGQGTPYASEFPSLQYGVVLAAIDAEPLRYTIHPPD